MHSLYSGYSSSSRTVQTSDINCFPKERSSDTDTQFNIPKQDILILYNVQIWHSWEDNVKMDITAIKWDGVNCIHLVQDKDW